MGQQEVYDLLKKYKSRWFSSKGVAEKLKLSTGSVTVSLQKLRKGDLIYFRLGKTTRLGSKRKVYVYKFRK